VVDFRPLRALRYQPAAGDPSGLIAPPFDVVSAADKAALYARSPNNIARIDYGEDQPGDDAASNRYTRARDLIGAWVASGVLGRDETPRIYVYDQEFTLAGETLRRRALFGRIRLEEWEKGIVLPHERTLAAAKADRLELLRATNTHVSAVMTLYRNDDGAPIVTDTDLEAPVLDARPREGERHLLRRVSEAAAARIQARLADTRLYIADGHHRYETALNYRNERRAAASVWSGDEGANFVMSALIDINDAGLRVLPIHRILTLAGPASDLLARAGRFFDVEAVAASYDDAALSLLGERLAAAGKHTTAYATIGLDGGGGLHLLTLRDRAAVDALVPQDRAPVWRSLDVSVLHHALLPQFGDEASLSLLFNDNASRVRDAVRENANTVGILMNPTGVEEVLDCADLGERMPEKSTFFYPKLATGMLLYPMD
jgi:uncharacterized protein (DUF1015 family)